MAHTVYLALGTNLGDRLENLQAACKTLAPQARLLACSPIYETTPWGYLDQPDFLNQVIEVETELSPMDLLAHLKELEARLGRVPSIHNGPRMIDLDILFYDDLLLDLPTLKIPHPHMAGRAFVLAPLADLAPGLRHPIYNKTIQEMLMECDLQGIQKITPTNSDCRQG